MRVQHGAMHRGHPGEERGDRQNSQDIDRGAEVPRIEAWRQKDPLPRLKAHLVSAGVEAGLLAGIEKEVFAALEQDQAWALAR